MVMTYILIATDKDAFPSYYGTAEFFNFICLHCKL